MVTPQQMISRLHLSPTPRMIPGSTIWSCQIMLTPKLAADWLERYNKKNRNARERGIDRLASDMKNGRWVLTHQGVAFDDEGEMMSGQHRCAAVVKSGVSIEVLVFINCSPNERKAIDQTASRNVRDVGLLGYSDAVTNIIVGSARSMHWGLDKAFKSTALTPQESYDIIQQHRKALDFVHGCIVKRTPGVTIASVMGAVCRGYYHCKQKDIKQFMEVLLYGVSNEERDRTIILLRNFLIENQKALNNSEGRDKAYRATERHLKIFCSGEPIPQRLSFAKDELFPLPATKDA